ncbi:Coiled-coil domain-containing protein [Helicobacter pylori]|nr:Coiled-coil domain-containing protein [Helicobacter pylori]
MVTEIREKEIELETLKREIAQAEASLENDFAKHMAEKTDEKLEDLFFNDKVDFYRSVLVEQNNYLNEHVSKKIDKALALSEEIDTSKKSQEIEKAKVEFLEKHKDENIDFNELADFYNEDLPQKYKREIDKLNGVQFFQAIYDLLKAAQGENMQEVEAYARREEERNLPKEVKGNGVNSNANSRNQSVMTRF